MFDDIRNAVVAAKFYLKAVQEGLGYSLDPETVSIEETELSEDGKYWFITLEFQDPSNGNRAFKVLQIEKGKEKVVSMKNKTS